MKRSFEVAMSNSRHTETHGIRVCIVPVDDWDGKVLWYMYWPGC
jgi:hypothetical protein